MPTELEIYRGFEIRQHEKPYLWREDFDFRIICVHCPEGSDGSYLSLSKAITPYMPWHGLRKQDHFYIDKSGTGPCDEDDKPVVSILYGALKNEDESSKRKLFIRAIGICEQAIDSLWTIAENT